MPNINFLQEHLGPIITHLIDLGGPLLRWRKIWTNDIDISGTGTVTKTPSATTDIVNKAYADALPAVVTVEEADGSPQYTGISTLRFDQADGFVVTNPGAGIARIDMTTSAGVSQVEDIDSNPQYTGITNLQFDQADGFSITNPVAGTARLDLAAIPDAVIAAVAATKITGTFDQLGASLTGTLSVVDGGTGAATLTQYGLLVGAGTGAVSGLTAMTKGQLAVGQTGANPTNLAIGTDGHVLTLDSSQAAGVKWAAAGAAGVQPIFTCRPVDATFPTTNFPQLLKNSGTNWVDYTLDFDQTTSEAAYWQFFIPSTAVFTTATIKLASRQAAATTGTAGWTITTLTRANGEAWDTAGNADTVTATNVPGTAGMVHTFSKALTTTGWAAGEVLIVKIARDVADTVAEDVKLMVAEIELA